MNRIAAILSVSLIVTNVTSAAYWSFYDNEGGDQLWSNPLNWDTNLVPDLSGTNPEYSAGMNTAQLPLMIDGSAEAPHFITNVWGAGAGANDAELLAGATFYVPETVKIGFTGPSMITNHGGTWIVGNAQAGTGGNFYIGSESEVAGDGKYIQEAGSLEMIGRMLIGGEAWVAGSKGLLDLKAGTVTISGILEINSEGLIDLGNGDLYLAAGGDPLATAARLDGYIAEGKIVGYGGAGEVVYELSEDMYHLYSVPEPTNFALLGVGSLIFAWYRRKQK